MGENSGVEVAAEYENFSDDKVSRELPIPKYLEETYWRAYVHPNAVHVFERQWLVNLILWGNFARLRNLALAELGDTIAGSNLQVACVYGDFSQQFSSRLGQESDLHIVDIAPVQLENVSRKIKDYANVHVHRQDSSSLRFADAQFDNVIVFFLLHEQPEEVRARTVAEALRVVKPGGKVVFVDYHKPHWLHPLRYVMIPVLHTLEPFAMDLWKRDIIEWVPDRIKLQRLTKQTYFGGLYQKVVMIRQ